MNRRKLKYGFFVIAIILSIAIGTLSAKEKGTQHFLSFGGDVNANLYFANFKQFEGVNNCCTSFGNTFGLGYNIHLGYEYIFPSNLFGMPWRFDLSLAYSDMSAEFSETNSFANIIIANDYVKGVAEFVIDPSVQAIIFDPGIFINPIDNIPLSIRLGFQVGFLMGMTYSQEERLLEPADVYYENGQRIRGQYSGPIPNAESQYFALSIGARYRAATFGNFALYPSLRFNYGLTNLVQSIDWKASTIQGGISLVYNFPEAQAPRPAPPPMPTPLPPAEPPAPATLEIFVRTELNGKQGNEFELPLTVYKSQLDYYLLPYIFFAVDSDIPIRNKSNVKQNIGEAYAQSYLTKAVAQLMQKNTDFNVILLSSSLDSEAESIVDRRITKITQELLSYGVNISRITVSKRKFKADEAQAPELVAENVFVKLELIDGSDLIPYTNIQTIKTEFSGANNLRIIPDIKTSAKLTEFDGKVYRDKQLIKKFNQNGTSININNEVSNLINEEMMPAQINIDAFAKNVGGAKDNFTSTIKLTPGEERTIVENNIYNSKNNNYSQYILCYFNFDKAVPRIVNHKILNIIKQAVDEGKDIQLIALTDNIGEKDYNNKLAEKRAKAALNLLKAYDIDWQIVYPENYIFTNDTPTGRMLNRTVVVRIAN